MTLRPFRFGLQAARVMEPGAWTGLAHTAESAGYSSFMVADHLPRLSTFPAVMAAASVTSSIRLSTYVLNQDFRPPGILAQEAASVQLFTGGRLELGIGAGWNQREYIHAGLHYDPATVRVARFDEYLQVVRGLLHASDPFSFDGQFFTLRDYPPLPSHAPVPILVGGGSPKILASAGQFADIISISTRATPDSRIDARNLTRSAVEEKLHWIRQSAGPRFEDIELNMTVRDLVVTDDRGAAARQLLAQWRSRDSRMAHADALAEDDLLDSPHLALGTVSEIIAQFEKQRADWGITYFEVSSSAMEAMTPILERLAPTPA